jgi:catechol 2,3-dioxygenase-like lactoylglutathione lyase family enzyme
MANIRRVQHVSIPIPPGGAHRARQFFNGVLGLPEKTIPASLDSSQLTWFAAGDGEHEIHCFVDPDYQNRSTAAHLCLEVDDLAAMRAEIEDAGISLDHEPTPIHNRPRAFVRDPFGNLIELTQIDGRYEEA